MLAKRHPELKKAIYCTEKMSFPERLRDIYFHERLWKVDEQMWKEQIRLDGIDEGKLEVARKMKDRGLPLEDIAEFTGLSFETIAQI